MAEAIGITPCPCGCKVCKRFQLTNLGVFNVGAGFTKREAQLIADLLNENAERLRIVRKQDEGEI